MPLHACSGPLASAPKPCFHVLLSHFSTSPVCLAGHLGPGGGKAGGEWGGVLRTRSGIGSYRKELAWAWGKWVCACPVVNVANKGAPALKVPDCFQHCVAV